MSTETAEWLNERILVGFTEKNGEPWWFRKELQGDEPTVYPGPIPREDVERRVFSWTAEKRPILVVGADGSHRADPRYNAIVHSETGRVFQVAKKTYVIHQYQEWLLNRVNDLLENDELHIGSAGLLRGGGGAWVTVERPDNVTSRSGMDLRPRLLVASSHDGRLSTTYKFVGTVVVCDNTLATALREKEPEYRVRHTMRSKMRLEQVRETLGILVESGQGLVDLIDDLADVTVTDEQWQQIVERLVPIKKGSLPRVQARLENKRAKLDELWRSDPRCAPWTGSALGAFQAFNTYRLHESGPDDSRLDRNMRELFEGTARTKDRAIIRAVESATRSQILSR